jgi:hypothetical protein
VGKFAPKEFNEIHSRINISVIAYQKSANSCIRNDDKSNFLSSLVSIVRVHLAPSSRAGLRRE